MTFSVTAIIAIVILGMQTVVDGLFLEKFNKTTIIPIVYNGSSEAMSALATVVSEYLFNNAFMKINNFRSFSN